MAEWTLMAGEKMNLNIPLIIKERLTMPEVLQRYGYEPKKRMCCPLHNGTDKNFSVMEHGYMCFSQCGGGDVITFVQKLFNLSFKDTLRKIDIDFGLGLYDNPNFEQLRKMRNQSKALQAKRQKEQNKKQQLDNEYWQAFDEFVRLEKNKITYAPKKLGEELHPLYVEAIKNIEYQRYLLEEIEGKRFANETNDRQTKGFN